MNSRIAQLLREIADLIDKDGDAASTDVTRGGAGSRGGQKISTQQVKVARAVTRRWATVDDISAKTKVARRTVHAHLQTMIEAGVVERKRMPPSDGGDRYRLTGNAADSEYFHAIDESAAILSIR